MWAEKDHHHRAPQEVPEVHRLDLAEVLLTLKAYGAGDLSAFRWLEQPEERALNRAIRLLCELRAMDAKTREITALGRELSYLPVHPRHGRVLLEAVHEERLMPIAVCVALLQGRPLFLKGGRKGPADYREAGEFSDFGPLLRAWNAAAGERFDPRACSALGGNANAAREAAKLADRLANSLAENPDDGQPLTAERLGRVLLSGFSDQVARRLSAGTQSCAVVGERRGTMPKETAVGEASLVVATEITEVEGKDLQVYLNNVTAIEEAWLQQMCLEGIGYKDVKDRSPWPVLQIWLSAPQAAALESFVPERLKLTNGNSLRMRYESGAEPVGSILLKHLYDETETPTIANGTVKVIIEVLAPTHRPIQLTKDLKSFWEAS